jgi:Cu/Ag efflux protein CusF
MKNLAILLAAALLGAAPLADVHGNVVRYDRGSGLLLVHHHPHAGMEMAMTMAVRVRDPHAAARLRPGPFVRLRCDARPNPWVCAILP